MKKIVFFVLIIALCNFVSADESGGKTKKVDPDREILDSAIKAYKNKDYEKAIGLWQQIENKKESYHWEGAVFLIGEALKDQGKYDEAIKQYDKLYVSDIEEPKPNKDNVIQLGNNTKSEGKKQTGICWMQKGQYPKALKALKFADQIYPHWSWCGTCQVGRDAVIPTYQGIVYEKMKNYNMALCSYSKIAFENNILNFHVQLRIFHLYQSQGKLDVLGKILDEVDKKKAMADIEKAQDSAEMEAFRKMATNKIRSYIESPQYYTTRKMDKPIYTSFRGVDFPPLPKKAKLPESLKEITGKNIAQKPIDINTREMILLLERAEIAGISTSHSQVISIRLKDGSYFVGKYVQAEAGRYSGDKELFDILNLVVHIKKSRSTEDVKGWMIKME
jgi:tetratricopeptide (TPR) repeat protein